MWNESAQNLVDIRIRSWILSSIYPTCSSFSLARTTTRTLRMVIKGDGRRLFCFCKSTRSFARFEAFRALFFSREKERRWGEKITWLIGLLSNCTKIQSCQNALLHTCVLSQPIIYTPLCCSLFFAIIIIDRFLLNAQKTWEYDAPSSRSHDDARHEVSRSLSVSDRVYYIVSHVQRSERNFRENRDFYVFLLSAKAPILYLRKN